MKKNLLIITVLLFAFNFNVDAQCKYVRKINRQIAKVANECNVTLDVATKGKPLFSKYRTTASFLMAKSGSDYYMYFAFVRNNSSRFDILKDNSLDFFLSNGDKVQLYPCGDFLGRYAGLSFNLVIVGLYQINKEQLEILAKSEVVMVSLHYTSEKELNGSQVDKDGKCSLDYEVKSEKYQGNPSLLSQCILAK